jgi:hypothetical protein
MDEGGSTALAEAAPRTDLASYRGVLDWPWSLLAVAAVAVFGVVKLALSLGGTYSSGGDNAFLELQIRQALHGGVALGPYSRYGWHHPGPLMFYLYAPLYWLTGESSRSLFLSSWLLNCVCAVGSVWILRRRAGEAVARLGAAAVLVYFYAAGFMSLIDPWNPSVLALPILLLMVSAAAGAVGSPWGVAISLLVASFLIQTHIATAVMAAVLVVVAVGGFVYSRFVGPDRVGLPPLRDRLRLIGTGLALWVVPIVIVWSGPLYQQTTAANGNLAAIARFYLNPPASAGTAHHGVARALAVVSDYATVVPEGNAAIGDSHGHVGRLLWAAAFVGAGLVAAFAWRRRSKFLAWLSLLTPLGLGVATVSALGTIGPYYGYLFFWSKTLVIPAVVAVAALGLRTPGRHSSRRPSTGRGPRVQGAWLGLAGLAALTGIAISSVAHAPVQTAPDSPASRAVATKIEQLVGSPEKIFTVDVVQQDFADGALVLKLAKDGYQFHMTPPMDLYSGDSSSIVVGDVFEVEDAVSAAPLELAGTHVMTLGNLNLWEEQAGG